MLPPMALLFPPLLHNHFIGVNLAFCPKPPALRCMVEEDCLKDVTLERKTFVREVAVCPGGAVLRNMGRTLSVATLVMA